MKESYIDQYCDFEKKIIQRDRTFKETRKVFAVFKFIFDRLVALFGLIVTSPLMLIISIMIKLDSKGPVLFRQKRTGKNGKVFNVYKFRTMSANNDVHDFGKADQHTRAGKILRKTSLDELPQLISSYFSNRTGDV